MLDLFLAFGGLADVPSSATNPWGQPDGLWLLGSDSRYTQTAEDWGVAGDASTRAVVVTDINHDGWLDLATREIAGEVSVWLANCGEERWIQVALERGGGNTSGVGAKVVVTAEEKTQRRWLTLGASGLQGTAPVNAHFGLGSAATVDIEVTWPDGLVSSFDGVAVNQAVRIVR